MTVPGFEYRNKHGETPFETFLRYTDEKEKSAGELSDILQEKLSQGINILDVGTGNGEYLELVLSKVDTKISDNTRLTLVEPSGDLVVQLKNRFTKHFASDRLNIFHSSLQEFTSEDSFDVILMSHLFYHLPRTSWTTELTKALSLLKEDGVLIIVLREKDDAYDFKMTFKPLLFDASFKALTIDDVLEILPPEQTGDIEKFHASAELHIPIATNHEDTISIIEFYLNKEWPDIPPHIQEASLEFIRKKGGVFRQRDGIAVVKRAG